MLSLEMIIILGFLYCFFMYGLLRVHRAKGRVEQRAKGEEPSRAQRLEESLTPLAGEPQHSGRQP